MQTYDNWKTTTPEDLDKGHLRGCPCHEDAIQLAEELFSDPVCTCPTDDEILADRSEFQHALAMDL